MISLKLLSFSEMSISEKCESFQWRESFCDSAVLEHFPVERDRLSARPRESGDPEPRAGSLWIPACAGMSGTCCRVRERACPPSRGAQDATILTRETLHAPGYCGVGRGATWEGSPS